jgi:hypothetical protein
MEENLKLNNIFKIKPSNNNVRAALINLKVDNY